MAPIAHPVVSQHTAGWTWCDGKRCYFYGTGVDAAYNGEIPEGFELRGEFPGSYYIVFNHPPFDYLADNVEVMKRVEALAWNFDPTAIGYAWNEAVCQDYQRHYPEVIGYQAVSYTHLQRPHSEILARIRGIRRRSPEDIGHISGRLC